ncbi:amidophosphoribosyltransferase [Candidatus Nomurabacteria bacterium RIFCSPLOWO2_02_40_28]|uniref:Amidophosphoribosyltransferase n=2 Tax=Candidatus Nomuraibacteriota TaxID=1752729 RepID=A0A837HT35_9BACT|nr:MAG: Amidophosphoribosyltransferase [Candidatus Nomurabacteria bacterium GW2011_GWD2_39_12]KKR20995.1 MAG: Amidophosphoribosyltransferase [Candidatus Nomurabacteria bacterium GW2011_GWC2_39_41]KKR36997.1 MAG: Amidophosphoribosyltransferase [Candidatus Nomurabacteria bacterium GW2011_GWE2_40_10]KKR38944.1 MAG: Amidophosphoribosyltransferase [Candidatus Nomurabacteria bacterium GW2011_GWB1_40_11]KKR40186.1 MAG: Amidophosphoribosyltransferase [Parcubacteria group bacterium GW2011_GWC1_40_11]KK
MNELKEKCGIVGIYGKDLPISRLAFFGLFALQHRGQEASGITTSDGKKLYTHKGAGLVPQAYTEKSIQNLKGYLGIGHNRYSTSGGKALDHAQPVVKKDFALAHNGNLPSVKALKEFLLSKKALQKNRMDSELITDAIDFYIKKGETIEQAVKNVFPLLTGSFSLVMMDKDTLVAVRDSYGMRPLALGKIGKGYVVASETCALQTIGATFLREVKEGEMIVINSKGIKSTQLAKPTPKHDIFEYVYFARPDSVLNGKLIYEVRKNFGKELAREFKLKVDAVVPVPDTATSVALGYSEISGIPIEMALIKNRYVHRTFIEPDQKSRRNSVALKLIPLPQVLKGKKIVLIDDSIVRGNTCRKLVKRLFDAGTKEVHLLISSPPVRFPDFYGIDTPDQKELIASHKTVEEIRKFIGATSLHFLSLGGLIKSIGLPRNQLSLSLFNGVYPIDLKERKKEINYDVPKN